MRGKGHDPKQLDDIEDHARRIFATFAPHLILRVDTLEGQSTAKYKKYKDYDTVYYKTEVKSRETRPYFYVDRKPNVDASFRKKRFSEIVVETGLSEPTVSKHLKMLIAEGLVVKTSTEQYELNPLHFGL